MIRENKQKIKIIPPAISVKDISKTFIVPHEKISTLRGAFTGLFKKKSHDILGALKSVSFEVKKGEFFGIVGRNGSGKSTLLKILAGVYTADTGLIEINGAISPFLELGIGFNPELSGRDNIYLNATVLGMSENEIDKKFNDIVAFSELERFVDQKLKNYSSGMQVRLAFSVSIHANRDILLMDEVLAVGDSNFQMKCLNEFNKYRDLGKTVVLVTHDIGTIQRYCDRAILLRNGEIIKIGKAEEVGNEYMYQNIIDEEERILKENNNNSTFSDEKIQEKLGKIAEIKKVEILDKNGKVRNVLKSGDSICIKVYFKRYEDFERINIGLGLYKDDGSYVFGYNTQMDNYLISQEATCVELNFESIPLLKGNYYLKCVCFGAIEQNFYDFMEKANKFQVFPIMSTSKYRGVVDIKHRWK